MGHLTDRFPEDNYEKVYMNMANDLKTILYPISSYLGKVDEDVKEKLTTGVPLIDSTALHLFIKGGKKIRAALVLLSGCLQGTMPDKAVEVASSTEICHAATLVHDDIIDKSILRRGNVTISGKWGNKVAVLIGDYMYTQALDVIVNTGNPALFPVIVKATRDMVKGELYQLQYSGIDVINREHYFNIIELKTARFMGACAKLGGLLAGLPDDSCDKLFHFGLNIGFAFQIVDDILDLTAEDITGKDTGNDFMDGKVTLPFIDLLENSGEKDIGRLKELASRPDRDNWQIVKKELINSGSIQSSISLAKSYVTRGVDLISGFPDTEYKDILIKIANFFVDRSF